MYSIRVVMTSPKSLSEFQFTDKRKGSGRGHEAHSRDLPQKTITRRKCVVVVSEFFDRDMLVVCHEAPDKLPADSDSERSH